MAIAYAPGLVLPYMPGKPQPEGLLMAYERYPDFAVSFLSGGFAQEKSLDRQLVELVTGWASLKTLEADWFATAIAFYYVTWRVESIFRWPWSDMESARITERGRHSAHFQIRLKDASPPLSFKIAIPAADNLTAIVEWIWKHKPTASEPAGRDAPPNWYPDPSGTHMLRYWDGAQWTDHYAD